MSEGLEFRVAELERRLANVVRFGEIATLDEAAERATVRSGDLLTGPLPWLTARAGPDREWWAPEPGEQVLLLCPGGEPEFGVIVPSLSQDAYPAAGDSRTVWRRIMADGTVLEYDRAAHRLAATLPAGSVEIEAPTVTITGDLEVSGDVSDGAGTMAAMRAAYNPHTHADPQGGSTGGPNTPM